MNKDPLLLHADDDLRITNALYAAPMSIQFHSPASGQTLVTIKHDGTIELGEGATVDDGARAFWDAVIRMRPQAMLDIERAQALRDFANDVADNPDEHAETREKARAALCNEYRR
jgi:hypothetical protein